jgi:uncharacterized OB-fold protein
MRDGYMLRVCPSCGAVATAERVTCDHCGSLTVRRIAQPIKRNERDETSSSSKFLGLDGPPTAN